jgi:hypothetical protein
MQPCGIMGTKDDVGTDPLDHARRRCERWATYANPRFGTTVDYPADIFPQRDPPPENGDGQAFRSRDGHARLLVWGSFNAREDTPEATCSSSSSRAASPIGRSRGATSRCQGCNGDIFYQRCNFPAKRDGVVDCFETTYPATDKATMDRVVTRLSRSVRNSPGRHPR